ncbi:MAG: hypothetical protein IPO88_14395 [Nannocystis sp.]|uniref:hypothetical protein n=1 Tax=Nannocystis sp. TaxID=1962667 RepID=UPI0024294199|nr:hypothetical protein [Nannocystis sp.]MBK9754662.1 hypothetical protein [Nannocystis sp.]
MSTRGAVETYLHWLQWRLGHTLVDDLMTPDQAVAWHELCRELRLGTEPLAEDIDEAELAGAGARLETWLEGQVPGDSRGLWVVGPARTGVCTLLHDLVLGLCGSARPPDRPQIPIPLLVCGNATRASICMLGLTGPWHGLSVAEAIERWWSAVELDLRRHIDRSWRAAPLRAGPCDPLVILGGVDELRELAAQQTVLAWARELVTAGVRVIVSSRDDDLPEQAALCEQGLPIASSTGDPDRTGDRVGDRVDRVGDGDRSAEPRSTPFVGGLLRRLHVLPLTRPPIDRFLACWGRIDGAWGRATPERLKAAMLARPALAALTRRPADLAVLAVLSAGTAELPGTLAELHHAMLGSLDLGHPAHRQLLARVVADPDSALDMPTRRAWLAALVAVAVACDHVDLGEALGRDVRLGPTGSGLLLAATRAWAEGGCPLRPVLADSPVRVPRSRCVDGHDDEMARLVWLGHHAGWWGPEAIFVLRRAVPARERLVEMRPAALRPRPLLLALAALDAAWGPCVAPLLRALPLGLLLAEGGTLGPVTATALYADSSPTELRPVRELFHRFLELELGLVSLAADDTTLQAIVMEMAAARDLDLDGALDLVLAQEGVGPRHPRSHGTRDEPGERGAYLDLALNLAARLTPCGAPALIADLERARRTAIHYSDCFTGALRARLEQLAGFLIVLLIYAIDRRLLQPARSTLRRAEVAALQQQLGAPERVAAGFPGERRAEVADDWRWVMRQPWAPHRIAGHLLARMPETLELDPEAVLPRCHAWLRAWLAEAERAA